jgi:nucleoside 2-deoxyribosyltransferase
MKIYVAGKWEDRANVRKLMDKLESQGHVITHDWTTTEEALSTYSDELNKNSDVLTRYAVLDTEGVRDSDILVALIDKDYHYAGTYGEIGMAVIAGKEVCAIGENNSHFIFFHHPLVKKFGNEEELLKYTR